MDLGHTAAAVNADLVAVVAAAIAAAAYRVLLRTGNRAVWSVIAGFAVLAGKNLVKGLVLLSTPNEPSWMEFAFSAADLVAVVLVALPILRRRAGAGA